MSSKNDILGNIRQHITDRYEMPDIDIEGIQYPDKIAQFIDRKSVV